MDASAHYDSHSDTNGCSHCPANRAAHGCAYRTADSSAHRATHGHKGPFIGG